MFVWVPGMAESLPSPLPPQRKRESSRGARAGVWGGEGISSGGVAGSLSCAGDGNEPPPHWFQFHFFSQKLVITIACVSGAGRLRWLLLGDRPSAGGGGGCVLSRDNQDKVLVLA